MRDIRYGARALLRRPGFTVMALVTFAVGIGANTAVFSLLHTILLDPLSFRDIDRLVLIQGNPLAREVSEGGASYPGPRVWPGIDGAFSEVSEFSSGVPFHFTGQDPLAEDGPPERRIGAVVSVEFFRVMGVEPILGRGFLPEEEGPGVGRVVVIGEGLWRGRYGGDPDILGRTITFGGAARTVVGIMPNHFRFPSNASAWIPDRTSPTTLRTLRHLEAVGRLEEGVSVAQANTMLQDILESMGGPGERENIRAVSLREWIFGEEREPVLIFYAVVSLVLLVACVNVANLFLARNETRRHELAVRASLGAGRFRVVREMLAESFLLAGLGGALGAAAGWYGRDLILAFLPQEIPPYFSFEIRPEVLLFIGGIVTLSAFLFSLVPALATWRTDVRQALTAGGRSYTGGKSRTRLWSSLVAVEVGLALTVLICANLMVKSVMRQGAADTGLDYESIMTVDVDPDMDYTPESYHQRVQAFYQRLGPEIAAIPGVSEVGFAQWLPTGENTHTWAAYLEDGVGSSTGRVVDVRYQRSAPGFLSGLTMIRLLRGRDFEETDDFNAPRVIIVNEALAERFWPGEDPLGKRLGRGRAPAADDGWYRVVGLVADHHNAGYGRRAEPQVYLSYMQSNLSGMYLFARSNLDRTILTRAIRERIWAVNPEVPLSEFVTMEEAILRANWQAPFSAWAFGLLSTIALILVSTGVYGLVAFTVTQRAKELSIRVAVGANPWMLKGMVVRESFVLVATGIAVGASLAAAGMQILTSILFMVDSVDPLVYLISAAIMTGVVLLATYLPARSIVRMEPMCVLGQE